MRDKLVDDHIARLATAQGGVVSARQLAALGLDRRAVSRRVAGGRLRPLHRGVFAVGHDHIGAWGQYWAAVLACGDDAVLSHRPAGAAWRLLPVGSGAIDVSVRSPGGRAKRAGLRVHRRPDLWPDHVTTRGGLPITTVERTLLDLAATQPRRTVEQALIQAEAQRLVDHITLTALATSHQPGAPLLRAVLATPTAETESPLEEEFLQLCDEHHLPRPLTQHPIGRHRADFLWPREKVIVEVDSHGYHRRRFEEDRERDTELAALGYLTVRVTKRTLTPTTAARLHKVLSARLQ